MSESPAAARVHVDIGRVVLHGFSRDQHRRFVDALQASLSELGADGRIDWRSASRRRIGRLDAGALPAGASPEVAAGHVIAQLRAAMTGGPTAGARR